MAEGHTEEARDQKWSLTTFVHISAPHSRDWAVPALGRAWEGMGQAH